MRFRFAWQEQRDVPLPALPLPMQSGSVCGDRRSTTGCEYQGGYQSRPNVDVFSPEEVWALVRAAESEQDALGGARGSERPTAAWVQERVIEEEGMRRLVLSVVLVAIGSLTFAAQAGAAASTVTTIVRTPIDGLLFASCGNGGAGEDVAISGTLQEVFRTTVDNVGGFHVTQQFNQVGVSGIGQVTGTKYRVTGGNVLELNMKVAFEETLVNNFRVIGRVPTTTSCCTRPRMSP